MSKKPMRRLSQDLTCEKHPFICQACGVEKREVWPPRTLDISDTLVRWQEHDENDMREPIIVVLCHKCSETLIEKHPRLYADLSPHQPYLGCMPLCVDCVHRDGTRCTNSQAQQNGGEGLRLEYPVPGVVFFDGRRGPKGGKRCGWSERIFSSPVTACSGKDEK